MTLLADWWAAIWPNLAASLIWAAPAFTYHHCTVLRRLDQHHKHLEQALASADRA